MSGLRHPARGGGLCSCASSDIAGAFDRVSHTGVLYKAKIYGISGELLTWLCDYLRRGSLRVMVNGQVSSPFKIAAGVPQGSILGPTLFWIYVNDAEDCLSPRARMSAYSCDTTMYALIRSTATIADSIEDMSASHDHLQRWGKQWRVRFEPTKSQLLHISNYRPPWAILQVSFGGHAITAATEVKLLGVTFNNKLNFASHIRAVALRATQRLGILRRASRILNQWSLLAIYRGFVKPILEYAPTVWMGGAPTHLHQLDRVQRTALHLMGVILQSLAAHRDVYALTFLYKLMYRDKPLQLLAILPRRQDPTLYPRTSSQHHQSHEYQLYQDLAPNAPNFLKRSFPHRIINTWNSLPPKLLPTAPASKSPRSFKRNVNRHLRRSNWLSATDSLWITALHVARSAIPLLIFSVPTFFLCLMFTLQHTDMTNIIALTRLSRHVLLQMFFSFSFF